MCVSCDAQTQHIHSFRCQVTLLMCAFFFFFFSVADSKQAFRPGATDMPAGATVAAPGAIEAQGFGEFDDVGMDGMDGVNIDVFSK